MLVSVSLLGWVPSGRAVLRSGAKVGDAIFVTGELGGSLAGKHLDIEPRIAEARWLAERFPITPCWTLATDWPGIFAIC